MKHECQLIAEVWDLFREHISTSRKLETAIAFLKIYEEHGVEKRDLLDLVEEDPYLARAFDDLYGEEEEDEEEDYEY
jgi:hypothetical protein